MHCEPASSLIFALGGLTAISRATGVSIVTVQRWRFPSEKGGTGGFIPRKYHRQIIELAAQRGIELPQAAFIDATMIPPVAVASDPSEAA